ncbi:MAG TPA: gamma-glutamyl-gamma-aminobutyrate hydrolase family protein [Herpetosiphonaceae bacterium]|nr:gamma-glutamyl-gamma-aminobutyrate hydrolase family protein [Herpetosiphonaceae bacterium]
MPALIGISGRSVHDQNWCPPLLGARKGYVDGVIQAGGIPVILPPTPDIHALRVLFERLDGLLLTGGVDIAPALYGEEPIPELGEVHAERDAAELPLARWAVAEGKPVLGICRGHQVLNVALGGTLYQDLPTQWGRGIDHELAVREECWDRFDHRVTLVEDSRLAELLGETEIEVNSLHHQAIKEIAVGLRAVGHAPDGVVEAVEGVGQGFVVGLQCHPEELWQSADPRWRNVFRSLVLAAEGQR